MTEDGNALRYGKLLEDDVHPGGMLLDPFPVKQRGDRRGKRKNLEDADLGGRSKWFNLGAG